MRRAESDETRCLLLRRLAQSALDSGQHRRHAAQPQRADQLGQTQIDVEVLRHREDGGGGLLVKAGGQDRRETSRGGSFGRGR